MTICLVSGIVLLWLREKRVIFRCISGVGEQGGLDESCTTFKPFVSAESDTRGAST
jgi:hypothetical protein